MKQIIILAIIFTFFSVSSNGQAIIITLENPSFENYPRAAKTLSNWTDCGFPGESPPDIQPGSFGVKVPALDGETYLGMVTRDNDTWERIGQQLSSPLLGGQCYQFSIYINRSEMYLSASQISRNLVQYNTPIVLRIWGGNEYCAKIEKLAESKPNTSTNWKKHTFAFHPTKKHTRLMFEAFYKTPNYFPYNGNILLDNASPIVSINCDSTSTIASSYEEKLSSPTSNSENYVNTNNGIYNIPSVLDSEKLDELIKKIHIYLSTNAKYAAEIYIEDKDLKAAKITKKLIIDRLNRRGWANKEDFFIYK